MRILLIDQFGDLGGAQQGLLEVAAGAAFRGWEMHAALPGGPVSDKLRALGARVHTIPCGPFTSVHKGAGDALLFIRQLAAQTRALSRIAERADVDVLYVNGPRMVPATALAGGRRPFVFHSHSVVTQALAARLAGWALRSPRASVLASSRFVAGWMEPWVAASRVRVIYNGVAGVVCPLADARGSVIGRNTGTDSLFCPGDEGVIGVLGRIAPEKGQLTFVRAARIASIANPNLRFVICGSPMYSGEAYLDEVRAAAGSNVEFRPWTDDIGAFFRDIDILAVPSEAVDANPRVIPEAFSGRVPVIAFRSGGVPELMEHGVSGIIVDQHTPEALAEAFVNAADTDLRACAERAYGIWKDRFRLERFQSEVCGALEEAARRHGRSPVPAAASSARV